MQRYGSKPEVYVHGYRDQANYITRRIEEDIEQILAVEAILTSSPITDRVCD